VDWVELVRHVNVLDWYGFCCWWGLTGEIEGTGIREQGTGGHTSGAEAFTYLEATARATATAKNNTGILRFAQNDGVKRTRQPQQTTATPTTTARATATTNADPSTAASPPLRMTRFGRVEGEATATAATAKGNGKGRGKGKGKGEIQGSSTTRCALRSE